MLGFPHKLSKLTLVKKFTVKTVKCLKETVACFRKISLGISLLKSYTDFIFSNRGFNSGT